MRVIPFLPKGFPIDKQNRLTLDRVKSIKVPILALMGGKGLNRDMFLMMLLEK